VSEASVRNRGFLRSDSDALPQLLFVITYKIFFFSILFCVVVRFGSRQTAPQHHILQLTIPVNGSKREALTDNILRDNIVSSKVTIGVKSWTHHF